MGKLAIYKFTYFLSIIFSLGILVLSIFSFFAGRIDPNENIYAAYIALFNPLLVVTNLSLLILWLFRFRMWIIFPILGLLANYNYLSGMLQIYNRTKYANETTLSVVTYNVHSFGGEITGYSAKEFLEIIKEKEVDVICFQEYAGNGDFTTKDIYELYSSYFPYSFIPENQSNAIYSRYPIRQTQSLRFQETNNNATWVDLEVNRATVRVINVHMQTTNFDRMRSQVSKARVNIGYESKDKIIASYLNEGVKENMLKRVSQAKMVQELVHATDYPIILCGDFNDSPGSYVYETLRSSLKDGFKTAGIGYAATYRRLYNLFRIDYLFHSSNMTGIRYEVIPFEMSDHNPVFLMVSF
ncbi:MAG: endonuclease/exonuclease/phosphatase family protein [Phocaeicola sp.]